MSSELQDEFDKAFASEIVDHHTKDEGLGPLLRKYLPLVSGVPTLERHLLICNHLHRRFLEHLFSLQQLQGIFLLVPACSCYVRRKEQLYQSNFRILDI